MNCQFPHCDKRKGVKPYYLGIRDENGKFLWASFCTEHAKHAEDRGARQMKWTPKRKKKHGS